MSIRWGGLIKTGRIDWIGGFDRFVTDSIYNGRQKGCPLGRILFTQKASVIYRPQFQVACAMLKFWGKKLAYIWIRFWSV